MKTSRNYTSLSPVFGGAALAASLLVTVPAAAVDGDAITACIGPGGQITHAAVGHEPKRSCPPNHVQETWALSGEQGPPGISCWDLDEDGVADTDEDLNKDGVVDVLDCRPAEVYQQPTQRTWYVASLANLQSSQTSDPTGDWGFEHDMGLYTCDANPLNIDESCVEDPAPDPCRLWYWDKALEPGSGSDELFWSLRPTRGYQYSVQVVQDYNTAGTPFDPTDDAFGWHNCLNSCLNDAQCVGASITESGENALACRLIAKTQFDDPVVDEYEHIAPKLRSTWALILYGWDNNFLTSIRDTVISVCPGSTP